MTRILVIKLGALGDFIQAFGPFAAIRDHHPQAEITLLTTRPFAELAAATPYFDHIALDAKPKFWQLRKVAELRRFLRGGKFQRVYDLQTSDRSSSYFRLMGGKVEWSGIAKGCSHLHANPHRDHMHTVERQAEQLAMAGIAAVPPPDLSWLKGDPHRFGVSHPFALLAPGGAPHRPAKRWPAAHFAELARFLVERGIIPVLLGTDKERAEIEIIRAACPQALDLLGRTSFVDILALAREATLALGNDTGPMHLAAAAGCPSVVLFSHESDPNLCAPRGRVRVLRVPSLDVLQPAEVIASVAEILGNP